VGEHSLMEVVVDERVPSGLGGRWYGVYPALVTDISDPDGQGRVKVSLPWSPDTGGGKYEAWARLAPMIGVNVVRGVTNETHVGPNTAYSARANDSAITGKVKARFVDANRFNAIHVKVVTENSNVYLLGIVTEKEGNNAAELARTTAGVRKVIKVFEYCKAGDDACRPREQPKSGETQK